MSVCPSLLPPISREPRQSSPILLWLFDDILVAVLEGDQPRYRVQLDWDEWNLNRREVAKILHGLTVIVISPDEIQVLMHRQPQEIPEASEPKPGS